MATAQFTTMLAFFKALSDESRLKIVGALSSGERSVDDLAGLLNLRAPTVSHHLAKLKSIRLVTMRAEGTTHFYRLDIEELRVLTKEILSVETIAFDDSIAVDSGERKILNDFFDGQRLKEIPASRKKRAVVLRWLAERFKFSTHYTEKQVNEIIKRHHDDFATLRRELIGAGLLEREKGVYWRLKHD